MPQKTYMYDTQWNQLINAINTGDSSAIITAISNIKTSIDNIYTRLNAVGFNSTQWDNLVDAINTGDSSAVITALNTIKNSLDNIKNAITNQSITVNLSNINSDNVLNLSNISGNNLTSALNILNINTKLNVFSIPFKNGNINFTKIGNILICLCDYTSQISLIQNTWVNIGTVPKDFPDFKYLAVPLINGETFTIRRQPGTQYIDYIYSGVAGNVWLQGSGSTIIK